MIKFSIIVPIYKVEEYLEHCVNSVLCQTYKNFQLILVDDGSPDKSGELADRIAEKDSRILVIHQENQGLSGARNTGIRASDGDYLMFLDSDDWWKDDSVLEQVATRLEQTGAEVLSFNYQKVFDGKESLPYFSNKTWALEEYSAEKSLEYVIKNDLWVTGACNKATLRRVVVQNDLFFRVGITSEDIDWTLRVALNANSFDYADVSVFMYRQRSGSITHSLSEKAVNCLMSNILECVSLLNRADTQKAELLMPFVAYQYATLLFNLARLSREQQKGELYEKAKELKYLLKHASNKKAKLIYYSDRLLGFKATLFLLGKI